jgi:hypothetical protein
VKNGKKMANSRIRCKKTEHGKILCNMGKVSRLGNHGRFVYIEKNGDGLNHDSWDYWITLIKSKKRIRFVYVIAQANKY